MIATLGQEPSGREAMPHAQALAGLKVLELARGLAGPFAATLLADFGAEVVKVEEPGVGDFMRYWGPANGIFWKSMARGKRSVAVDLRNPEADQLIRPLVEWADVLVESYRPGVLEALNLAPGRLGEWNPDLIILRISGYGQTGRNRELPGFGKVAEAYGGLVGLTGFPGEPPVHAGFALADMSSGLMGAFGVLLAVVSKLTGESRGQIIDLALYETILRLMDYPVPVYTSTGDIPERHGNHQLFGGALSNVFPTRDGRWVTYSAGTEKVARRVLGLIGGPEYAHDPRFSTMREICLHEPEIDVRIAEWMSRRTAEEAVREFTDADAVAAIVRDASDIVADPHIAEREDLIAFAETSAQFVAPIPKLSNTPGKVRHLGPSEIGQDWEHVLKEVLGLANSQIESLVAARVVTVPSAMDESADRGRTGPTHVKR